MTVNHPDLFQLAEEWDRDHDANLAEDAGVEVRGPYTRLVTQLTRTAHIRFEPYQNDAIQGFVPKLRHWLGQFQGDEQRIAFLLATKIIFVGTRQFEALQRDLFEAHIRRHIVERVVERDGLPAFSFVSALAKLEAEIDATLFVANSDSSALNSFVHVNRSALHHHGARRLTGPELGMWLYPRIRAKDLDRFSSLHSQLISFEADVLATDPLLLNKRRLVILEDFSGSGSDLTKSLRRLAESKLPFDEVLVAVVVGTAHALNRLRTECSKATRPERNFSVVCSLELPDRFRCFNGPGLAPSSEPSYLNDGIEPNLSGRVKQLSDTVWKRLASPGSMNSGSRHGFGGLALAYVSYFNCPDNSLPMLWIDDPAHKPLFRRVSRYI